MIGRESKLNRNIENVIRIYRRLFVPGKVLGSGHKVTGRILMNSIITHLAGLSAGFGPVDTAAWSGLRREIS